MAIILQEEKQSINWTGVIGAIVAFAVLIGGAYVLFFAPVPAIEGLFISKEQQLTTDLAGVQFDPDTVIQNKTFRSLQQYAGAPAVGQSGRSNPLIKF